MSTIAYSKKSGKVAFVFAVTATNDDFDAACKGKPDLFVEEVANIRAPELLLIHNALADKPVEKFADVTTAVDRVEAVIKAAKVPTYVGKAKPAPKAKPVAAKGKKAPAKPTAKKGAKAAPKAKKAVSTGGRAAAIAKSWKVPAVLKARTTRHSVTVNGTSYRSTGQAFEKLGLPMGVMIPFRIALKATGKKVFEHGGKKFNFTAHRAEA